jgi:hypothetical protein
MKSLMLNFTFLVGYGCIVGSGFLINPAVGLAVLGFPMVAVSVYLQNKGAKK